jgi:hypothetical protein
MEGISRADALGWPRQEFATEKSEARPDNQLVSLRSPQFRLRLLTTEND